MAFNPVKHNFTIKSSVIDYNTGEYKEDFNNIIDSVAILKDFKTNIFPLYVISMALTNEQREYLAKNKFYISLTIFRCTEMPTDNEDVAGDSSDPITDKIVHNIILRPFDNSKLIPIQKASEVADDSDNINQQFISYTINCVPKEQLQVNNSIVNSCYENANLNEIAINVLSDFYTKDIYFQESTNIERYDSLLIPQMSVIQALRYLQEFYVLYSQNLNMFFEDSKFYIYDMYDKTRKFNNGFYIEINNTSDDNQNKYRTHYVDEFNNVKKYLENNPMFVSTLDTYRYTSGEKIIYGSYDDNFNLVNRTYNLTETGNTGNDVKTRYKWNINKKQDYENRNLTTVYLFLQQQLRDIDPTYFEPDTMVNISGASEELNGEYAILSIEEYYSSKDYKNFNNTLLINLGKI